MANSRISITGVLTGILAGVVVIALVVAGFLVWGPQSQTEEERSASRVADGTGDVEGVEGNGRVSLGSLTVEVNDNPDMTIRISAPELPDDAWDGVEQTADPMIIAAPVDVTTAEPLTGTVTLTRTYPVSIPTDAVASFGYFDEELQMWIPVPSTLSEDRTVLTATVDHLSIWTDIVSGTKQAMDTMADGWKQATDVTLRTGGELLSSGGQLLYNSAYYVVGQVSDSYAPRPECTGSVPTWADPEVIMLDDAIDNPARWCVGSNPEDPEVLMVRVSNNRGYPVTVKSSIPALSAVPDGMDIPMLESLFQSMDIYGNMADSVADIFSAGQFSLMPQGSATLFFDKPDSAVEPVVVEVTPSPRAVALATIAVRQLLGEVTGYVMGKVGFPVEDALLFAAAQCIYAGGRVSIGTGNEMELARECITGAILGAKEQGYLSAAKIAKIAGDSKTEKLLEQKAALTNRVGIWVSLMAFGWSAHQHIRDSALPDIARKLQVYMNVAEFYARRPQDTSAPSSSNPTEKRIISPVDRQFNIQDGWRQSGPVEEVSGYCSLIGMAQGQDIYRCGSNAQSLAACFFSPVSPTQGICLTSPFSREYRSIIFTGEKSNGSPGESYPWGLVLEDGRECTARMGGAWGARADNGIGTYSCGTGSPEVGLAIPGDGITRGVDISKPTWTLQMGEMGEVDEDFPPPRKVGITTAYYVAWAE